jgi:hypothetical protein
MAGGQVEREGREASLDLAGELAGSLVPGLGAAAKVMARRVLQEWSRNGSVALRAAEKTSGLTREEIGEAVAEDPRLLPLATRLLHAAGMNGHDRTLAAMGAAFGDAVRSREALDECELILTSLADLTDSHTLVLLKLTEVAPNSEPHDANLPNDQQREAREWTARFLREAMTPMAERVTTLCVAALIARGLVRTTETYLGGYEVTELGRVVLDVLEQHAATANPW